MLRSKRLYRLGLNYHILSVLSSHTWTVDPNRMTSRKMGLKSISRVCFRSFCEVEFRNVERLKVAREINQNIFRIFPVLFYFSDFPFGIRFSLFAIVFDFMFSKTRRTQIVLYRDLNFSRFNSFCLLLRNVTP